MKQVVHLTIGFLGALLLSVIISGQTLAHWADLAVAEIFVDSQVVEMQLTFPTGIVSFADTDRDGRISATELTTHQRELQQFLSQKIQVTDRKQKSVLTIGFPEDLTKTSTLSAPQNSHSTLILKFQFLQPIDKISIHYNLFLPGVLSSTCLATILQGTKGEQFIFSPHQTSFPAAIILPFSLQDNLWWAVLGAFLWGGVHALSPGHGKTLVGAYLVGERSTWLHAVVLGIITTATHTIGVVFMGIVALAATQVFPSDLVFPWLSLAAGLGVLAIGVHLFWQRWHKKPIAHTHSHSHTHHHESTHSHCHNHEATLDTLDHKHYHHKEGHSQDHHDRSSILGHGHDHRDRSSIVGHSHDHPDGSSVVGHSHDHTEEAHSHHHYPTSLSWRSLIALGIAGGITPCPAALVLMLGAISLHQVVLGIGLVLSFSLGLAWVLVALGLLLIGAKRWFQVLPIVKNHWRILPLVSAFCITLLGIVSTWQALRQIIG